MHRIIARECYRTKSKTWPHFCCTTVKMRLTVIKKNIPVSQRQTCPITPHKMADKMNTRLEVGRWVKKVLLSFIVCGILIFCLSVLIQRYNVSEKYMAIALFLCGVFYLYQIFSIIKIRCPNCNELPRRKQRGI
jgi:hypothetical protein